LAASLKRKTLSIGIFHPALKTGFICIGFHFILVTRNKKQHENEKIWKYGTIHFIKVIKF
jgi:hypothetical protein